MRLNIDGNTIQKKQFLGRNDLTEAEIPPHVKVIESWAFAQCSRLREIILPAGLEYMGKDVFCDCTLLKRIYVRNEAETELSYTADDRTRVLAELTAAAYFELDFPLPEMFSAVGTDEWIRYWDILCIRYLQKPDEAGFSPFLAGGEEDYEDADSTLSHYCHTSRRRKVDMVIKRLLAARYFSIEEKIYAGYISFLRGLMGCDGDESRREAREAFMELREHISECFAIFDSEGLLDAEDTDGFISEIAEENVELKALLLRKRDSTTDERDTWEAYKL